MFHFQAPEALVHLLHACQLLLDLLDAFFQIGQPALQIVGHGGGAGCGAQARLDGGQPFLHFSSHGLQWQVRMVGGGGLCFGSNGTGDFITGLGNLIGESGRLGAEGLAGGALMTLPAHAALTTRS